VVLSTTPTSPGTKAKNPKGLTGASQRISEGDAPHGRLSPPTWATACKREDQHEEKHHVHEVSVPPIAPALHDLLLSLGCFLGTFHETAKVVNSLFG
jgi:hypothetical protein